MGELRTGIIGVAQGGAKLLTQLSKNKSFKIQAIADDNKEMAQSYAQQYDAQPYDDFRSLIVQEKLDVIFLLLPTYLCRECIHLAAKKGVHIFKGPPLARTVPEAAMWVELMEKCGGKFHIGSPKRFAPGYLHAHQKMLNGQIGKVYLAQVELFFHFQGKFGFRGDPVLSGGGVLLESGYQLIDQIVWNMGPPEQLYSLNTNYCSKGVLPPYRTEDTAVLTMNFSDGAMGNFLCSWMAGADSEKLVLHGTNGRMEATESTLGVYDSVGNVVTEESFQIDEDWLIAQQIRQFADSIFDEEIKPVSTAREHLVNVAIIEAAYLSARTQLPESLKVYGSVFKIE